jgi:alpha-1,2-mannosyltransferase
MNAATEDIPNTSAVGPFWRRIAGSPLWDIMAILLVLMSLFRYANLMPQAAHASDFSHYYLSCRMLLEGRSPYATPLVSMAKEYDLVLSPDSTTGTNPPVLQWVFAPFAMLAPRAAFWLWSLLQVIALGTILWLTRLLLAKRLTTRAWRFVVCGAIASVPMLIHFTEAQTQLLIGALVLAALFLLLKGRPTAACLTVVAAGLLKLFPFVLLPWFIWRGGRTWRQRAILSGVSLAAIAVSVAISGPSQWQDFIQNGLPSVGYWSRNFTFNYCLASLVKHCGWSWNVGLAVGGMALVGAYAFCLRLRDDDEAQFCLLSLAMLAGGTTSWSHYMVLAIFPVAAMVTRVSAKPSWARVLLFTAAVMALDNVDAPTSAFPETWHLVKLLWIYTPLFGQLALAAMFVTRPSAIMPRRSGSSA